MTDYYSLLTKALDGLEDNSGPSRRKVYEKARNALVNQLQSLEPKLPASEVTRHRLSLEDAIRKVEQDTVNSLFSKSSYPTVNLNNEQEADAAQDSPSQEDMIDSVLSKADNLQSVSQQVSEDPASEAQSHVEGGDDKDQYTSIDNAASAITLEEQVDQPADQHDEELSDGGGLTFDPNPVSDEPILSEEYSGDLSIASDLSDFEKDMSRQMVPEESSDPEDDPFAALVEAADEEVLSVADTGEELVDEVSLEAQPSTHDLYVPLGTDGDEALNERLDTDPNMLEAGTTDAFMSDDEPALQQFDAGEETYADVMSLDPQGIDDHVAVDDGLSDQNSLDDHKLQRLAEEPPQRKGFWMWLIILVIVFSVFGGAGYAAWATGKAQIWMADIKEYFTSLAQKSAKTTEEGLDDAAKTIEEQGENATQAAGDAANTIAKDTERLANTAEDTIGNTISQATSDQADPEAAQASDQAAAIDANKNATKVHLEEQPIAAGQQSSVYSGKANFEMIEDENGQNVLKIESNVPALNMTTTVIVSINKDPATPASHLFEIQFEVPSNFHAGGIANLEGVVTRNVLDETLPPIPLAGLSTPVMDNYFLYALDNSAALKDANVKAITAATNLIFIMQYSSSKKAVLSMELGEEGKKLLLDIMKAN